MRLRKVWRVARWEVSRGVGCVDRRTLVSAAALLGVVAVLTPTLAVGGVAVDAGLYRVGIAPDSPLYEPAVADPTLAVREPSTDALAAGDLDVLVDDGDIRVRDTSKGRAAVAELREAAERYTDRTMAEEANRSAAFPVYPVTVRYVDRAEMEMITRGNTVGTGGESGDEGTDPGDDVGGGSDGDERGTDAGDVTGAGGGLPALGGDLLGASRASGTPSDLSPPFPLQSLLLAFVVVLPLNFVAQAYGNTMLKERLNRRGELLLVAPLSRVDVVAGKTLPYLLATLGFAAVAAVALGGGMLTVLGVVPIALLFLATTFLAAMVARSFRELTFLTVTLSVGLTTYAFVPAIFTGVPGVALVSPLTLVVRDLSGAPVTAVEAGFSTLPPTLAAGVLYGFATGLYREEDMFTQRPVPLKLLDALASRIPSARSLVAVTALLVPFVFVAELLVVATLFALPGALSVPLVLTAVAVVEELAKSLPVLAGFEHGRFERTPRAAAVAGAFSGLGFFLGEKFTLVVQLVGLPQLRAGSAAFHPGQGAPSPFVAVALLLAPLVLHVATAVLSSVGATEGKTGWLVGLATAVGVHLTYNAGVIAIVS